MSKNQQSLGKSLQSFFAATVILVALTISVLVYIFVFGNPANFEGMNNENHPLPGNYLGIVYKGGPVVSVLMSLLIIVLAISIERYLTISRSKGKGKLNVFVHNLQQLVSAGKIDEAIEACDKQKGSLANVMRASLVRYKKLMNDNTMDKDQKIIALQKELEEATTLELPMLSKNLVIISTIASVATLTGLIGTVLGMIKAFAALAQAGAPDAVALANGISEALINTALGVTGSTIAIIMYNYFNTQIDSLTYKIDEAGFSLVQTFASQTK